MSMESNASEVATAGAPAAAGAESLPTETTEAPAATRASARKSKRVVYVDILRLIASTQMLNGHTLDAVVLSSVMQGPIFERYNFGRGLVSVAFLVVSGIAFHLSTTSRFERHKSRPEEIRRRFRTGAIVVAWGFALNLPWGLRITDPAAREAAWRTFTEVSVLHCIGTAILILEAFTVLARRPAHVFIPAGILAVTAFTFAPMADGLLAEGESHWLLNWVSRSGGSMFPLVPWAGYVMVGLLIGGFALPDGGHTPLPKSIGRLAILGAIAFGAMHLYGIAPDWINAPHLAGSGTSPVHAMKKLVWVVGLIMALAILSSRLEKLPKALSVLASHTLFIYVFHLFILFKPIPGIAYRFDHSLTLVQGFGVVAVVMASTFAATLWWHRYRTRKARA